MPHDGAFFSMVAGAAGGVSACALFVLLPVEYSVACAAGLNALIALTIYHLSRS